VANGLPCPVSGSSATVGGFHEALPIAGVPSTACARSATSPIETLRCG
jgi:hypothetical protein